MISFLPSDQRPGKVAFSSGVERKMFPMHHAPTRMGIEQVLRGAPHRGPGCYSEDIVCCNIVCGLEGGPPKGTQLLQR